MIRILSGTIVDVNSKEYVCHIRAFDPETSRSLVLSSVPFLTRSLGASAWSGTTEIPERLSACFVLDFDGQYYLLDTIPPRQNLIEGLPEINKNISLTQTADPSYTPGFINNVQKEADVGKRKFLGGARVNRPHDALPGDKFWKTREGAFWGVLRGGVILGKVHEFCQLMMSRIDALFRLVTRNLQVFTDWGRIDILNDKGDTNLAVRVGELYLNNKSENYTVRLDVGMIGNLIHLKVTTPGRDQLARVQIFPTGEIEVESVEDVSVSTQKNVNINAVKDINIKADTDVAIKALQDVKIISERDITITAKRHARVDLGSCGLDIDENGNVHIFASNHVYIDRHTTIDGNLYVNGTISCKMVYINGYDMDTYIGNYLAANGYSA